MDKSKLKKYLPVIVLALILVPIITNSILDIRQERKGKAAQEKLLAEEQARKISGRKVVSFG